MKVVLSLALLFIIHLPLASKVDNPPSQEAVVFMREMIEAIKELGAGPRRIEKFSNAITGGELSKEDTSEILRIIEAYGKGRFSQRLAQKITSDRCPPYIQKANECLKSMLEQ